MKSYFFLFYHNTEALSGPHLGIKLVDVSRIAWA